MIIKLNINTETLEVDSDLTNLVVNEINNANGIITVEVSIPDPEFNFESTQEWPQ